MNVPQQNASQRLHPFQHIGLAHARKLTLPPASTRTDLGRPTAAKDAPQGEGIVMPASHDKAIEILLQVFEHPHI
jgi:hypothetical protein